MDDVVQNTFRWPRAYRDEAFNVRRRNSRPHTQHRRQTLARHAWRCPRGILVRMRAYALHRAPQLAPGCCVARRAALQRPRLC